MSRIYTMAAGHVTKTVVAISVGAVEADKMLEGIRDDLLTPDAAWLKFLELVSKEGLKSGGPRSYLITLAKRGAGA